VAAAQKFNIQYDDLVTDPLRAVSEIYAHFGETLTPAAEAAMGQALGAKDRGGYGGQRDYALAKFGIRPEALAPRFANYLDYFGIVPKRAA
jgi:hypothetical protein